MSSEVRYLGQPGSYSHEIALRFMTDKLSNDSQLKACQSITQIITTKATCHPTYMVLPLENTTSGDVYETYYQMFINGFDIVASYDLAINHALFAHKNTTLKDIKNVYSHPQALMQVSSFINDNNMLPLPDFSTTEALARISDEPNYNAAIASSFALKYYSDLHIINDDVSNGTQNYTRFIVSYLTPRNSNYQINLNHQEDDCLLFLLFELNLDDSGELNKVLALLTEYNINLFSIKSRPTQIKPFEYFFVVESEVSKVDHHEVSQALMKVSKSFIYNTY